MQAIPEEVAPVAEAAPVVIAEETATAEAKVVEMPAAVVQTEPATSPEVKVSKGAGVLARARKAYAPMATPAAAPAPTPREPVEYAPLVRSEVVTSGRHGGSTAASNVATSPAGRP